MSDEEEDTIPYPMVPELMEFDDGVGSAHCSFTGVTNLCLNF